MNENLKPAGNGYIAYLLLRLSLGLVIFLHGVVRLAGHYQQFVASTERSFAQTPLPAGAVHFALLCIPWVEAVLGFFILTGLLTRLALIGGALLMMVLLFGKCMEQDWTVVASQLWYSFLFFVLLAYSEMNRYALDRVMGRDRNDRGHGFGERGLSGSA